MSCRVCLSSLTPILTLPNMPAVAQHLPDYQRLSEDRGITLEVMQCTGCALVQLTNDPPPYWREGIRSDVSQAMRDFRKEQLAKVSDGFLLLDLEHCPEPNAMLANVRGNGGLVEVPNFDMILERGMVAEFMRDHLMYFTAETLRRTLEINGFDVLEINTVWYGYVLSARVRKRATLDLSKMKFDGRAIHEFIDGRASAIWGAGHQALATMSLLKLTYKDVKYVVDSAPAKQGRYTPVTHIPIVPPKALETDPVEALVVMCGSYSAEVAEQARAYNVPHMMVV